MDTTTSTNLMETPTTTSIESTDVPTDIFTVNENDYQWINNSDGKTVTIIKFLGTVIPETNESSLLPIASINIPYILGGRIVSVIGPGAYANNTIIDRVVIHADIITIDEGAFAGCTNLQYASFFTDCKLKYINDDVFLNTSIKTPVIPESVIFIGDGAFNTNVLKTITFNGNAPEFTSNSFNSQNSNGNYKDLITIIHYTNATGFNNPNENKFTFIINNKMMINNVANEPEPVKSSTSIIRYIIYFLLFVLLIVLVIFIYRKLTKKPELVEKNEVVDENELLQP
jgi:hypothetical protein